MFNDTWLASNVTLNGRNFTAVNESDDDSFTSAEVTAMLLCHGLLGTLGFLENLGVILVILHNRLVMLDVPSVWFVLSLATSDAVTCVVINIFVHIINNLNTTDAYGQTIEHIAILFRFVVLSSTGSLFILTFNRFLSVYNSLRYPAIMTTSKAKGLVLVPWIIASILCAFNEYSRWGERQNRNFVLCAYYGTLILLVSAMNIYIFKQAREKSKEIKRLESIILGPNARSSTKEYRLAIRLLIITLTLLGSTVSLAVVERAYGSRERHISTQFMRTFIWWAVAMELNAIVDPFIYSINYPIFRRYFRKIRNRLSRRNKVVPSVSFHKESGAVTINMTTTTKCYMHDDEDSKEANF